MTEPAAPGAAPDRTRALDLLRLEPEGALAAVAHRPDPWSTWARAAMVMATGDFRHAFHLLSAVTRDEDAEAAGMAAARMASGLRQLGEHAAAVPWDERACRSVGQAVVDGWVGRAADDVGLGDAGLAAASLATAERLGGGWRDDIRRSWVRTEIALMCGDTLTAERHAARALAAAEAAGSPRHVVKSKLFLGAARRSARPVEAVAGLREGLAEAEAMRLRAFVWPIVLVLAEDAAAGERAAGSAAARFVAAHLPLGYGQRWLARDDIRRLLAS